MQWAAPHCVWVLRNGQRFPCGPSGVGRLKCCFLLLPLFSIGDACACRASFPPVAMRIAIRSETLTWACASRRGSSQGREPAMRRQVRNPCFGEGRVREVLLLAFVSMFSRSDASARRPSFVPMVIRIAIRRETLTWACARVRMVTFQGKPGVAPGDRENVVC